MLRAKPGSNAKIKAAPRSTPQKREHPAGCQRASQTTGPFFVEDGGVEFDELRHDTTCRFQNHGHGGNVQEQAKPAPVKVLRQQGGHHEELHHTQTISGNVEALVELHQVLRVAKQPSPPQPASGAPEEKGPCPAQGAAGKDSVHGHFTHDPRKCAHTQDETRSQRRHAGRKHAGHGRESIKYLSTWSAWLPCADVRRRLSRARRLASRRQ